jgi:cell division protease FtsH
VKELANKPWAKWLLLLPLVLVAGVIFGVSSKDSKEIPVDNYTDLVRTIESGQAKSLQLDPNTDTARVTTAEGQSSSIGVPASGPDGFSDLVDLAKEKGVEVSSQALKTSSGGFLQTVLRILPTLALVLLIGGLAAFQFGWFSTVTVEAADTGVSFSDVAGCGEAIEELEDVRSFLQDPKKFERLGARVPKGVLLYGPPGTGKTLLAKAVASEAGIPFFSASGSEFVEMFAGLGAKRVRGLFDKAKKSAPSIIFIDELDAVGGHRTAGGDGASKEADQTLIQILKEMDGFSVSENPVIVIGATNRLDSLDRALVRPGRFDRHVAIDPPDRRGRQEILEVHARGKALDPKVDLELLAIQTAGMTGADLSLILNEAALLAARRDGEQIESRDIDDAYFRIVAGAKKQHRMLSPDDRETVAIHDSGHALVGELLSGSEKLHKVSIIPRGRSGGQTLYVSDEDVFLYSEEMLRDRICGLLAGRAAEEAICGRVTNGAGDDLRRASEIALQMITEMGMSKSIGLRSLSGQGSTSATLRAQIDEEVQGVLDEEYSRALEIIRAEEGAVERLRDALLVEETLDRERFLEILEEKS